MTDEAEAELLRLYGAPRHGRVESMRALRAWILANDASRRIIHLHETRTFIVPSQTHPGTMYDVFVDHDQYIKCLCPDFKARREPCFHCLAVLYRFFPSSAPAPPTKALSGRDGSSAFYSNARRVLKDPYTYSDGPAESTRHDQALAERDDRIEELLVDIGGMLDVGWLPSSRGPRRSPGEILAILILREHHNKSMRATRGFLKRSRLAQSLQIFPVKNTLINYMQSLDTARLLQRAFALTIAPFRLMDQDIIIDSTGFSPLF